MEKDYNHLSSYEWLGEFWFEETPDEKFPGIISYSPISGLLLSVVRRCTEESDNVVTIHGYSQETGLISLLKCFTKGDAISNFSTQKETFFCSYLVTGKHLSETTFVEGCTFELSNLREFCFSHGSVLRDDYTLENQLEACCDNLNITLTKTAKAKGLSPDRLSSLLVLDEKYSQFKKELDEAAKKLSEKHGLKHISAKTDIGYEFSAKNIEEKVGIYPLIDFVFDLANLQTILMLKKVIPLKIKLLDQFDEENNRFVLRLNLMTSLYLTEKQVSSIEKDQTHRFLPVNINGVKNNFNEVLRAWIDFKNEPQNIVLNVIYEHIGGGFNPVQHSVLLISAMEQWYYSNKDGVKNGTEKYEWLISQYTNNELQAYLEKVIPIPIDNTKNKSIGELLTIVRGIILHPDKLKKITLKDSRDELSSSDLANISEVLYFILVIAVYRKIGVESTFVDQFLNDFDRYLPVHSEI